MIEPTTATTTELEALVSMLSRVGSVEGVEGATGGSDAVRVDQLAVLERVKAAAAAAQARVTAAFVDSRQVAQAWRERSRECSEVGDFDGWRAAREQARAASFTGDEDRAGSVDPSGSGGSSVAGGRSDGRRRRASGMAGVAAQVALARRESPVQGAGHVRLAVALTRDLRHTLAALTAGDLNEWRAQIIVRETATLTAQQRALVDAEVIGRCRATVAGWGDRELARQVRAAAYRIDAGSVLARAARAETERRVTLRPAPDTMAYLTALLPVAQAVAVHAALVAAADTARATSATSATGATGAAGPAGAAGAAGVAGDGRGKGQVMADTLVTRVTGQASAGAVPVEVQLVMTDRALLAGDDTPAQLTGYGIIPAAHARALLTPPATPHADRGADADSEGDASAGAGARVWLRRLYTHPVTGALVGMDSHRRTFDGGLRRYLLTRDAGTCRTPWCDAPARHLDHVHDHADGGPTTASNGQGLCVRCNLVKQLPGFHAATRTPDPSQQPGAPHTVVTTTPTGHTYTSHAPPLLPGLPPALADHDVTHPDADPDAGDPDAIETGATTPDIAEPILTDPQAAESHTAEREPVRVDLKDLENFSPFERLIASALAAA